LIVSNSADRETRLDDVVLGLLWSNSFEGYGAHRAWKSLPWDVLDRLHAQGLIEDPRSKNKSVVLSEEAIARGRAVYLEQFASDAERAKLAAPTGKGKAEKAAAPTPPGTVHRFKITLDHIQPPIWRRVEVASDATFWDLHCALNDAMGWEDEHLHAFRIGRKRDAIEIGIPEDDPLFGDAAAMEAGWDVPVARHFAKEGARCIYEYDFGDGWTHTVVLEAIAPREAKTQYPRCTHGARACPPEDCGGFPGYQRILALLAGSKDDDGEEDADELLDWLGDDFDPEAFDARKVRFTSAARRLKSVRRV
jgi:hypothetical protein